VSLCKIKVLNLVDILAVQPDCFYQDSAPWESNQARHAVMNKIDLRECESCLPYISLCPHI